MGNSTTVKAIVGMVKPISGGVYFDGNEISKLPMYRIARVGIGLVPEGRRIFPNLTVYENIVAPAVTGAGQWSVERVFDFFPRLGERSEDFGSQLSGGEQQILAIGRALATNPAVLLLDEATEGLAPLIRALHRFISATRMQYPRRRTIALLWRLSDAGRRIRGAVPQAAGIRNPS